MQPRWNVLGTPVFGPLDVVRLLKRLDDGELNQVFTTARDQGECDVELKGKRYRIARNFDYTYTITPANDDHQLISR